MNDYISAIRLGFVFGDYYTHDTDIYSYTARIFNEYMSTNTYPCISASVLLNMWFAGVEDYRKYIDEVLPDSVLLNKQFVDGIAYRNYIGGILSELSVTSDFYTLLNDEYDTIRHEGKHTDLYHGRGVLLDEKLVTLHSFSKDCFFNFLYNDTYYRVRLSGSLRGDVSYYDMLDNKSILVVLKGSPALEIDFSEGKVYEVGAYAFKIPKEGKDLEVVGDAKLYKRQAILLGGI